MAERYPVDLSAMPFRQDIRVRDGNGHRESWAFLFNGAALDLTSVTWALRVSPHIGGTPLLTKTTSSDWAVSGVRVDGAAAGQITLSLVAADVTTLTPGDYVYDVTATFPVAHGALPGLVKTILAGRLTVEQDAAV